MDETIINQLKSQPGLLVETIRDIFRETASNVILGYQSPNAESGFGLIDINKALNYIDEKMIIQTKINQQTYPSLPHEGAGLHKACSSPHLQDKKASFLFPHIKFSNK